jgi:hypothetical protein
MGGGRVLAEKCKRAGKYYFQLVSVDSHWFRVVACTVIKLPFIHVGKLIEESLGINNSLYA